MRVMDSGWMRGAMESVFGVSQFFWIEELMRCVKRNLDMKWRTDLDYNWERDLASEDFLKDMFSYLYEDKERKRDRDFKIVKQNF